MLSKLALRSKLLLLIAVPLVALLVMAGLRISDQLEASRSAQARLDKVEQVAELAGVVDTLGTEQITTGDPTATVADLSAARLAFDQAAATVLDNPSGYPAEAVAAVQATVDALAPLRVTLGANPAVMTAQRLANPAGPLSDALRSLNGVGSIADPVITVDGDIASLQGPTSELVSLSRLIQSMSTRTSIIQNLPLRESVSAGTIPLINAVLTQSQTLFDTAIRASSPKVADQIEALSQTAAYAQVKAVDDEVAALVPGVPVGWDVEVSSAANDELISSLVETRRQVVSDVVGEATTARDEARRDVAVTVGVILAVGLILLALTIVLYRSIRRPLRKVTDRSRKVAEEELPSIVDLMRTNPDAELPEIEPIEATSKDEIGELVEAFNEMAGTAIHLAGEQAASRRNVGDMFMNLGRRNQKLLNRLLRDLSELERTQEDADTLAALYGIDHLATRMRRNAESLLVLAGAEQARRWKEPISSGDVVRAALSEVENYERVTIDDDGRYKVDGAYVADLAHLLAELLENALMFSPPASSVQVVTRYTARGFMFAILDSGVGMSDERITEANATIASAADEYETPSSFLGHFVVGRIAARRGFEVMLLEGPAGGLAARVMVPAEALVVPTDGFDPVLDAEPADEIVEPPQHERTSPALVSVPAGVPADATPADAPAPPAAATTPLAEPVAQSAPASAPPLPTRAAPPIDAAAPSSPVLPTRNRTVPDAQPTKFGVSARRPGANLPESTSTAPAPALESARAEVDLGDPDAVRTNLSSFQQGTRRAEAVAAVPTNKFGVSARRPGANLPTTALPSETKASPNETEADLGDPEAVRSSLSSFQRGTSRADREGDQR